MVIMGNVNRLASDNQSDFAQKGNATTGAAYVELVSSGGTSLAGASSTVTITRPNDTAAYTAGDVIGAATGSTAAVEFANIGPSGAVIRIMTAKLRINVSAIPSGMTSFKLRLYNVTPPSALGDNAAWDLPSGDRASYVGHVDLGTPIDEGSTLYVKSTGLNDDFKLTSTSLFGYLVTNGAFTPSAQAVKSIELIAVPL